MPYRVVDADNGTFVRSYLTELPYEFSTGAEAQEFSKRLADDTGRKYRVKKVLNAEWRKREQHKFDTGEYEMVPWVMDDWWMDPASMSIHRYQFPHPSRKQPGMLSFTESEEKGMDNIVTRVKPGRYLEQFRSILKVYGRDLQRTAARFTVIYEPRKLMIAETEDEIQWVYENGPPSCMSTMAYRAEHSWGYGGRGKWPLGMHACRVYAGPDLKVAYIVADEDHPKKAKGVLARAVIWPERKTHSRIYGEELALAKVLEKEGYTFTPPIGARLQRHLVDKIHFVCPYIDGGQGSGQGAMGVVDRGDHLEIVPFRTPLSYCANATSGVTAARIDPTGREAIPRTCQRCGGSEHFDAVQVFTSGTDYLWWCGPCREGRTQRCAFDGRFYDTAYMDFVEMYNGDMWAQRSFNARGFTCQATGKRYPREAMVKLEDGTLWNVNYAQEHGTRCAYSGHWVRNEDIVKAYDRKRNPMSISKTVAGLYCFVCSVCQENQYDPNKFGGSKPNVGPFICHPCEVKKNPALKAGQPSMDELNDRYKNLYCYYQDNIVSVADFVRTKGYEPSGMYTVHDLRFVVSAGMYEQFMRHGPSRLAQAGVTVTEAMRQYNEAEARIAPYAVWHNTVPIPAEDEIPLQIRPTLRRR